MPCRGMPLFAENLLICAAFWPKAERHVVYFCAALKRPEPQGHHIPVPRPTAEANPGGEVHHITWKKAAPSLCRAPKTTSRI